MPKSCLQYLILSRSRLGGTCSDAEIARAITQLFFGDTTDLGKLSSQARALVLQTTWLAFVFAAEQDRRVVAHLPLRLHMMSKGELRFQALVEDITGCIEQDSPYLHELLTDTIALEMDIRDRRSRGSNQSPEFARTIEAITEENPCVRRRPPTERIDSNVEAEKNPVARPKGLDELVERVRRANQAEQWGPCISLADRALELNPDHDEALHLRALAQHKLGLHEQAIASVDKALAVRPSCERHTLRGRCLLQVGRYEEAYFSLREGLLLTDVDPQEYHRAMAYALRNLGKHKEAYRELTLCLAHRPNDETARAEWDVMKAQIEQ